MRDIRHKVALHLQGVFHFLECILQTRQHGIEGIGKLTHFIGGPVYVTRRVKSRSSPMVWAVCVIR